MSGIQLDGESLSIEAVLRVARQKVPVQIAERALHKVKEGRRSVERILVSEKISYGINTGFGKFSEKVIDRKDLLQLQLNLIRSHAVGTGDPLPEDAARAVMLVRLNTLLKGRSGIRPELAKQIMTYLNSNVVPEIPRYGSLGASGDLAPSAHFALTLVGEGKLVRNGRSFPANVVLKELGIKPLRLREKEGLAIINGTQVMTGLGCLLVSDALNFFDLLDIAAVFSLEALGGNIDAFESRVHNLRPIKGQTEVAERIRALSSLSKLIGRSKRVQDPYSLRCIPQVHGAFREVLDFARKIVEIEINSVTDNPIIFAEDDSVISAGNFHGQPIAVALDMLAVVIAEACTFSERRIDKLLSGLNPKLPLFLTEDSGLSSGMMVLQYTAAALNSKIALLATPAGLWTATVSAGQEDHSSMGMTSALKAQEMLHLAMKVVGIELICASQAAELLDEKALGTGSTTALKLIRQITHRVNEDRSMAEDLERLACFLEEGDFAHKVLQSVSFPLPGAHS